MAKLKFINGDDAGKEIVLDPTAGDVVLGREDGCDIQIQDVPGVSRRHARFTIEKGTWSIEDLGSFNGVYCGTEKVTGTKPLTHKDVLWFSQANLLFVDTDNDGKDEATLADARVPSEKAAPDAPPTDAPKAGASPAKAPRPDPKAPAVESDVDVERIREVGDAMSQIRDEFSKVIVGQKAVLEELLLAILANGHCLIIGLPGVAKTLMVRTLSEILDLQFKRIQFTPDLMPSDIIGSDVLEVDEESGRKAFRFIHGPIFTNMLLADEINRTPPKTQAALLEAMQEKQVTASNQCFPLPSPFFVLATQNPLEQEGTYPLPEAQLDRFMFNIIVDYPDESEEEQIVAETTRRTTPKAAQVITADVILSLQNAVLELPVSPHVVKYATRLARASRPGDARAPDYIKENVGCGAGPRAGQFLVLGAKARAILHGRLNVECDDVRALALPVLRHRIFTNFTADSEGITPDNLIKRLLLNVPEPDASDY